MSTSTATGVGMKTRRGLGTVMAFGAVYYMGTETATDTATLTNADSGAISGTDTATTTDTTTVTRMRLLGAGRALHFWGSQAASSQARPPSWFCWAPSLSDAHGSASC
jgi:hypothetical protein